MNEIVFKSVVWKKGDGRFPKKPSGSGWESNPGPLALESCVCHSTSTVWEQFVSSGAVTSITCKWEGSHCGWMVDICTKAAVFDKCFVDLDQSSIKNCKGNYSILNDSQFYVLFNEMEW